MRSSLLLFVALFALAACGDSATPPDEGAMQGAPPTGAAAPDTPAVPEPTEARIEDGVQIVEIEAGPMGFRPAAVTLRAGVPARLVFTRTVDSACSSQVQVPDFGIEPTDLPMNEPVAIAFTPAEAGDFSFICGMEMQRGTLVVQS